MQCSLCSVHCAVFSVQCLVYALSSVCCSVCSERNYGPREGPPTVSAYILVTLGMADESILNVAGTLSVATFCNDKTLASKDCYDICAIFFLPVSKWLRP